MPRRQFVKQLGAAGAALAAGPTAGLFAQEGTPRRPNIIFLLADDMRWDAMGCMGNRFVRTPHLDRLAAQGVLFENAFVTMSICAPNRACVLAGQHQRTTSIKNGRLAMATRHHGKLTLVVARSPLPKWLDVVKTHFAGKEGLDFLHRIAQKPDFARGKSQIEHAIKDMQKP